MPSSLAPSSITQKDIPKILSRYADVVPSALKDLDVTRYETIPVAVEKRKSNGDAYLSKSEVESLVQWKIKHGKFRPTLPKLVASNDAIVVEETTRKAFKHYSSNSDSPEQAVKILNELKGIGPATSSLLLSIYDPSSCPFFSDEFFRYMVWDTSGSPAGWDRKLKYDMKELSTFYREVEKLLKRLRKENNEDFTVADIEKAAFVLGKEKVDLSSTSDESADSDIGGVELVPPKKKVDLSAANNEAADASIEKTTSGKRKREVAPKAKPAKKRGKK